MKKATAALVGGVLLTVFSQLVRIDDSDIFSIIGTVMISTSLLVAYAAILGLVSALVGWFKKDIKKHWFKAFSWLFLFAGIITCLVTAYISFNIMPVNKQTASKNEGIHNHEICYHKDERLAAELIGFTTGQGMTALQCDKLMQTNKFSKMEIAVIKTHEKILFELMYPYKKFCNRYGVEYEKCRSQTMENIAVMLSDQKVTKAQCRKFATELKKRKNKWDVIANQLFVTIAVTNGTKYAPKKCTP